MSGRRPLAVLAATALFSIGLGAAVAQLSAEYRSGTAASAGRLARDERADPDAIDRTIRETAGSVADGGTCAPVLLEPTGALLAEQLDLANEAEDYDGFVALASTAEAFYLHALGCDPTSSRVWTRLGTLEVVATNDLAKADRRVEIAGWNSPVFWPDLKQRIAYWKHRSLRSGDKLNDGMGRDLQTLLSHAKIDDIRLSMEGASPEFLAQLAYHVRVLSPERVAELKDIGLAGGHPEPAPAL